MLRRMLLIGAALLVGSTAGATGLHVVVVLDNSGSMNERMRGERRIDAAKRALLSVLEQTPPDAELGVLVLNPMRSGPLKGVEWIVPLGPLDAVANRRAVEQLGAGGPTPLGAAMKTATDALLAAREEDRYGDYKLLVVSDGEANDPHLVQGYLPTVLARGVLLDVIGVAMKDRHSLAERASTYRNAADPASLEQAISAVVLGESTDDADEGDASDASGGEESDFELIAPLPVELATAALAALGRTTNEPITAVDTAWGPPGNAGPQPGPNPGRRGGNLFPAVLGFIALFFVIARLGAKLKNAFD